MKACLLLLLLLSVSIHGYSQSDADIHWEQALEFHQKGDYLNAALEITTHVEDSLLTCGMVELVGDCCHKLELYELGARFFELALPECEMNFESYVNLGDCYFKLNKIDSALIVFKYAYSLHADNPSLNFNLGLCYYMLSEPDSAKRYLKRALLRDGEDLDALELLIQTYNETGESDSSFVLLRDLKSHENKPRVMLMRSLTCAYQEKYRKSLKLIDRVLRSDVLDEQTRFNAYLYKYQIYKEQGKTKKACEQCRWIRLLYPDKQVTNDPDCE